jgi:hypothetical protein
VSGLFTVVIAAQVYRYRRVSTPTERQQTKWVVFGFILSAGGYFGMALFTLAFHQSLAGPFAKMIIDTIVYCFTICPTVGAPTVHMSFVRGACHWDCCPNLHMKKGKSS